MPDISETLAPNSQQLDNIDLRGGGPRIFTVTAVDVRPGTDQPVTVHLAEFDRPWKPGKNMRRVLAHTAGAATPTTSTHRSATALAAMLDARSTLLAAGRLGIWVTTPAQPTAIQEQLR